MSSPNFDSADRQEEPATEPKVAILLCNYNHASCLPRALDGIFGQTRQADEILLLDDGSSDQSFQIMERYASRHPNARLIRHDANKGLMTSIAELLEATTADYVVWAASDDELLPSFLAHSLAVLKKYPGAGVCFSELNVVPEGTDQAINYARDPAIFAHLDDTAGTFRIHDIPEFLSPAWLRERLSHQYLCISSNTALLHRGHLVAAGGFAPELKWHADWFAIYTLALQHGACVVPEPLTRLHAIESGYSRKGMENTTEQSAVLRALLNTLAEPANADLRVLLRRCPAAFAPFGELLMRVALARLADWDLAVPYAWWYVRALPARSGLGWPALVGKTARRLARSVRT